MAWTTPITWGTATVTVAQMNEQVRDNMNYLNNLNPQAFFAGGRLTPTSANPYGTGDIADVSTVYYTPATGNRIALYDGASAWDVITFSEGTIDVTSLTASKPYDVFMYNNGGTATLETLVWTNGTTRATGLSYQDGVLVKTGATTRRYLGGIYVDAGTVTQDSLTQRFIINYYNSQAKLIYVEESTSHTYNGAYRKWNNSDTNNLVEFFYPVREIPAALQLTSRIRAGADGNFAHVKLYLNGVTSGNALENWNVQYVRSQVINYKSYGLDIGYNALQTYEYGDHASSTFSLMQISGYVPG